MKRMLVLLAMLLVCSIGAGAAGGARAVIDLTPNRTYFMEDELVLFDGSNSYSDECDYVIACEWRVDGVLVSELFTYSTAFTLAPGQVSKTVSVSLWVMDEYENTDDRTISIVIRRRPQPYFYLTDHLGSIRATVKGGEILVTDDFSGTLSKWAVAQGSGFAIESGVLSAAGSGRNIIVNSSAGVLADGIVVADIQTMSSPTQTPCIVVRYQDSSNYYYVRPSTGAVLLYERMNGSETIRVTGSFGDDVEPGVWYHLQVVTEGGKITVYTLGSTSPALEWTDPTPWLSGKVGLMQSDGAHAHWDNVTVTTGSPGLVVSADDYDAWGLVLESMSYVQGNSDTRYKFTGKERDVESLYDYFGARYYDARIGRFLSVDPRAEKYPNSTPYGYVLGNPLAYVDPNGDTVNLSAIRQYDMDNGTAYLTAILSDLQAQTGLTYSLSQEGNLLYETANDGSAIVSLDANGNPSGSAEARSLMFEAISNTETANGFITPGRESGGGGLGFGLGPEQIQAHIEGAGPGLDSKTMGWGTTFMHELSHTTAGGGSSDGSGRWLDPGPIEARMNLIRSQLGAAYGQRLSYGARRIDGVNYIPFGPVSASLLTQNVATRAYTVSYTTRWRTIRK